MSISYLLNFAEQNPRAFPNIIQEELVNLVKQHHFTMDKFSSLLGRIKRQRNQTLAHLDKILLNAPGSLLNYPPPNYKEVENLFDSLFKILDSFSIPESRAAQNYYRQMGKNVHNDLNYLVGLIKTEYHGF
jgi:hypothetical protein